MSPKASRPAPVVAPGEPEEVVKTAKKSRIRDSLATNWREGRKALVSTYGCRLHGQRAQAAPSKPFFDKAQAKAKAAAEARWANHRVLVERVESLVSPTHKRTEGRAPVWGSEFTSKRRRTTGGDPAETAVG